MKEELISFETAKLAKEVGFDGLSYFYYMDNNPNKLEEAFNKRNPWDFNIKNEYRVPSKSITAPAQSLLQRWLREKHKLWVLIYFDENTMNTYCYFMIYNTDGYIKEESMNTFNTYEEALEAGLLQALKLIKT